MFLGLRMLHDEGLWVHGPATDRGYGSGRVSNMGKRSSEACSRHQQGTVSLATSKLYTRAVLPPAILACSSSGTPARISARILRDWGNVDSLVRIVRPHIM